MQRYDGAADASVFLSSIRDWCRCCAIRGVEDVRANTVAESQVEETPEVETPLMPERGTAYALLETWHPEKPRLMS